MEKILPKNEGRFDRALRIALGVGLLSLTVTGPATAWEAHLRGCDVCERFGADFSADLRALRARLAAPEPLDAELNARLRKRLRQGT